MLAKLAMTVVVLATAAACTSGKHSATSTPPSTSSALSVASTPAADTPTAVAAPAVDATGKQTCRTLKSGEILKSVEGFIIVSGVLSQGDVLPAVDELHTIAESAPEEFQHGLVSLAEVMQEIDDSLAPDYGGDTVDTSSVDPNVQQLVGLCRARGVPISMG